MIIIILYVSRYAGGPDPNLVRLEYGPNSVFPEEVKYARFVCG